MAWLDDRVWCHPKLVNLSDAAFRVWINGLAYSFGFNTGGVLTSAQQKTIGATPRLRRQLLAGRAWDVAENGAVVIHNWKEHNGKREAQRLKDRDRKRQERADKYGERPKDSPKDKPPDAPKDRRTLKGEGVKGEEVPSVANATSGTRRPRQRDELWDVFVEVCGEPLTESERGRRNKAVKELRAIGATYSDVMARVIAYRREWPDVELTATAIAANWTTLAPRVAGKLHPCPHCQGISFFSSADLRDHLESMHPGKVTT